MKVFISILTLPLFIFVACQKQEKSELLKAIDSLIVEELYDSAYSEVQLLDESFFKDESDLAHFHLLQIQTSYITMKPVPADSIINQTVHFYEQQQNDELLAEAYYYRGTIYYDSLRNKEAVACFKKAEDSAAKTGNNRLKYKIAKSLSNINRDASNYNLQLSYAEQAYQTAKKADNKKWIAYALYHISCAYSNMLNMEKAREYADAMLPYIQYADTNDFGYLYSCVGYAYKDKDKTKSKDYFLKSLTYKEYTSTYEHLADIEMSYGNREKASYYWKKAFALDDNSTPKDNLLYNMLQYDLSGGNTRQVCERIYNIMILKDSINEELKDRTIMEIQNEYDTMVARHNIKEKQLWITILSLSLLACLLLFVIYIKHRRSRLKQERSKHQMTVSQYLWEIEGLKRENEVVLQQITDYKEIITEAYNELSLSESEEVPDEDKVNKLKERIKDYKNRIRELEEKRVREENVAANLKESLDKYIKEKMPYLLKGKILYDKILNNCKIQKWTKEDLACFLEYYKTTEYKSYSQIDKKYIHLTDYNKLFLILYELGKEEKEIQEILSISLSTIRVMKHRIKQHKK